MARRGLRPWHRRVRIASRCHRVRRGCVRPSWGGCTRMVAGASGSTPRPLTSWGQLVLVLWAVGGDGCCDDGCCGCGGEPLPCEPVCYVEDGAAVEVCAGL